MNSATIQCHVAQTCFGFRWQLAAADWGLKERRFTRLGMLVPFLLPLFALAAPIIKDLHKTSVELLGNGRNFAVVVQRIDSLYDTLRHRSVASRYAQVVLEFSVVDNQVSLNNQPVKVGMSRVTVQAKTATIENAKYIGHAKAMHSFDQGLVAVDLYVQGVVVVKDGRELRAFVIAEKIAEINGKRFEQRQYVQQVITIEEDGSIEHGPCHTVDAVEPVNDAASLEAAQQKQHNPNGFTHSKTVKNTDGASQQSGQDGAAEPESPCGVSLDSILLHSGAILLLLFFVYAAIARFFSSYSRVASDDLPAYPGDAKVATGEKVSESETCKLMAEQS